MSLPTFEKGCTYNLTTHSPAVLGSSFDGVNFEGEMSYAIARLLDSKLHITHSKVLPSLNAAVVTPNAADQEYLVFTNPSSPSQKIVLAKSWLYSAQLVQVATISVTMVLSSKSTTNLNTVRALLNSNPSVIQSFTIND